MSGIKKSDLVIIGAGPVGLYAGILAHLAGLDFMIVEKNERPLMHSRSAGIHPPSLKLFARAGLIDTFLKHGIQIRRGHARTDHETILGTLYFKDLEVHYPFILTIPQWKTEQILEQHLVESAPGCLLRGVEIVDLKSGDGQATIYTESNDGEHLIIESQLIMACDGKKSPSRYMAGIPFTGKAYPHRYVMGDFPDQTNFSTDAVIYLSRQGLVESFPLPNGLRRWVVQQEKRREYHISDIFGLTDAIHRRCGIMPDPDRCLMYSEFGVERNLADTFWRDRLILAGDAAHVVSPIGGQGMNLGWLTAADAITEIKNVLDEKLKIEEAAKSYDRTARKRAWKVIRRSEWNMALGNRKRVPLIRNYIVKILLNSPLSQLLKTRFTMQGL